MERCSPHLPAGPWRRVRSAARQVAGRAPLLPLCARRRDPLSTPPASRLAELEVRRLRGGLGPRAPALLLAVEDPWARLGSGGATLNALLVAAEHLSARAGCTVRGDSLCWVRGGWKPGGGAGREGGVPVPSPLTAPRCPLPGGHR